MKRVLLALALLVVMLGAAVLLTATSSDETVSYRPSVAGQWVELNPKRTDERRREHKRDEFGRHSIDVLYLNDNTGKLVYRSSGALESELVVRSDGMTIKSALYAEDGKTVVSGFERRIDGTLVWKTDAINDHSSITTVYWGDGQTVFGASSHNRKTSTWDNTEHNLAGAPVLLTQSSGKRVIYRQVEFYPDGKVFRERVSQKDASGRDVVSLNVYRADATVEGRQVWEYVRECDPVGGFDANGKLDPNAGCSDNLTFKRVEMMSADGQRVERVVNMSEATVEPSKVTDFHADGSKVVRSLTWDKTLPAGSKRVSKTTTFNAAGVEHSVETPIDEVFKLDDRYRAAGKFQTDLLQLWRNLELAILFSQP